MADPDDTQAQPEEGPFIDSVEVERSDQDGQWYFRGKARNNEIVFSSEGYVRKIDAVEAADRLAGDLSASVEVLGD